jgi:hypothetical protein
MATHDQVHLGPIFEELRNAGLIEFGENENSYGIAAAFVEMASEDGVVIHTDQLCELCAVDDAGFELVGRTEPPGWHYIDVPVVDGVAVLPGGQSVHSDATVVHVPVFDGSE